MDTVFFDAATFFTKEPPFLVLRMETFHCQWKICQPSHEYVSLTLPPTMIEDPENLRDSSGTLMIHLEPWRPLLCGVY